MDKIYTFLYLDFEVHILGFLSLPEDVVAAIVDIVADLNLDFVVAPHHDSQSFVLVQHLFFLLKVYVSF